MGKSTVASLFKEAKFPVICADEVSKEVAQLPEVLSAIRKKFGDGVFNNQGELNREKLGDIIFNDKVKRG